MACVNSTFYKSVAKIKPYTFVLIYTQGISNTFYRKIQINLKGKGEKIKRDTVEKGTIPN